MSQHLHPLPGHMMCEGEDKAPRKMTEGEVLLFEVGLRLHGEMRTWRKSFWLMVACSLVLVCLMWVR